VSLRSVLLTLLFLVAGALWVRQVSLVGFTCQVAEGTPSVPALMALILLGVVALMLRRRATAGAETERQQQFRREALLIYLIVSLALPMSCANVVRQLLPALTALRYFAAPENSYAEFAGHVPAWLAPNDEEAVRQFYEGSAGGAVPWQAWQAPLLTWTGVFLAYSLSLYCLVALFRKPWAEHERLTYPLAELALQVAPGGVDAHSGRPLLRQGLFWLGFGVSAVFNLTNVVHAFSPQVAALGVGYDLGAIFTQRPWSGLRPLYLAHRPEIVGLGYLVPVDILLSTWAFYLAFRLETFLALMVGYEKAGFPFEWPQGFGAYVGLAAVILYSARTHLRQVLRLVGDPARPGDDGEEALPYRVALGGFVAGFSALVGLCLATGIGLGKAVVYIGLSYLMALAYSRVRAQTGVPISYVVPRRDVSQVLQELWPTRGQLSEPQIREETSFALLTVLNRLTFPHIAAFETEGIRLADQARIRRTHLSAAVGLGVLAGILLGYATHLTAYYTYGCNVLEGGTTQGGWRTRQALIEYEKLQTRTTVATPMEWPPVVARALGGAITGALVLLRARFLRFPLHPMGLALAATFGYHTWFPLFLAWLAKVLILRLGGARLYRTASPAFLGLAVGHFVLAGAAWGLTGVFNEEAARRYLVWFA
jgi:MYXO-CTERM domain-containing protein